MTLRVILDANIIISALLKPKGKQAAILRMAKKGLFQLQISTPIFDEIKKVFEYPKIWKKLSSSKEEINETLAAIIRVAQWIEPDTILHIVKKDPADNKYLECAVEGGTNYIITGDEDLLSIENFQHTKIITSGSFLKIMNKIIKS